MLAMDPKNGAAYAGLGTIAGMQRQHSLAAEHFAKACEFEPGNQLSLHNYGESLRQIGRFSEAETIFRRVIALDPHFVPAYDSLIPLVQRTHDLVGEGGLKKVLARELAILASNKGNALLDYGESIKAIESYRRSILFLESYATGWSNLTNALRSIGKIFEAEEAGRKAISLDPEHAPAWNNLGNALAEQGEVDDSIECYDRALVLKPDFPQALHNRGSGILMNLLYSPEISNEALFEHHRRWGEALPGPSINHSLRIAAGERPLRIGYLSGDFRQHSMCHFLEPILAHHNPAEVEVTCYSESPVEDAHTQRLRGYGHSWVLTHDLGNAALAARIKNDGIDILIECSGHTQGTRLKALAVKPAPVMISWLGYLGTTGLPAMDYRMTDIWVDPPGLTEAQHTENLLYIPGGMIAYRPHDSYPGISDLPFFRKGHITFGSLNNIQKLNKEVISLWAHIMREVQGSTILIQSKMLADRRVAGRIQGLFEAFEINKKRIELREASPEFLKSYDEIDISLDPFPYGGGATTFDALWMGVPVVTLSGSRPAGRLSTSILQQTGYPEWCASTPADYLNAATILAWDPARLATIRKELRCRVQSSSLCDEVGYVRRLEKLYRELVT